MAQSLQEALLSALPNNGPAAIGLQAGFQINFGQLPSDSDGGDSCDEDPETDPTTETSGSNQTTEHFGTDSPTEVQGNTETTKAPETSATTTRKPTTPEASCNYNEKVVDDFELVELLYSCLLYTSDAADE